MTGFEEREKKRKRSVIGKMISNPDDENPIQEVPVTEGQEAAKQSPNNSGFLVIKPKRETRSKKIPLLVRPSVYEKAVQKCKEAGVSFNECINQFLEKWTEE